MTTRDRVLVNVVDDHHDYLYDLGTDGAVRTFVASTTHSRRLLTEPFLVGAEYTAALSNAAARAVQMTMQVESVLRTWPVTVVTALRGGLAFDLPTAIEAASHSVASVAFVGTDKRHDGRVVLDYERWALNPGELALAFADIISTGNTAEHVIASFAAQAARTGVRIREVLVVAITTGEGLDKLTRQLADLARTGDCKRIVIVALESLFVRPSLRRGLAGALDLLRSTRHTAPAFELARLSTLPSLLERCAIYDGGERAFEAAKHVETLRAWWTALPTTHDAPTPIAIGRELAGLGDYERPMGEWRDSALWDYSAHFERVAPECYDLGRSTSAQLRGMSIAEYAERVLASAR